MTSIFSVNIWCENWRQNWPKISPSKWRQCFDVKMTSSITSLVTSKWCQNDINVTSNWCEIFVKFWSNNWRQFFPLTFDVKIDVKFDENFDIKLTSSRQQNDDKMTSNWHQRRQHGIPGSMKTTFLDQIYVGQMCSDFNYVD